jgi:hypothetical protein
VGTVRKQTLPFIVRDKKDGEKLELDLHNFNAMTLVNRDFSHVMKDMDLKDHKGVKVGKILAS